MKAYKWNYKTRKYDDWFLPITCILYSRDLKEKTSCAQCNNMFEIGNCYTSKEIHDGFGFGFPVCGDCHNDEIRREKDAKR